MEKKLSDTMREQVRAQSEAALINAKIEGGKLVSSNLFKIIGEQIPSSKELLKDPLFQLLLANCAGLLLTHYMPDNKQAQIASEALLLSSTEQAIDSLQIKELFEQLLAGVKLEG